MGMKKQLDDFEVRLQAVGNGVMMAAEGRREVIPGVERTLIQLQRDFLSLAESGGAKNPAVAAFGKRLIKMDGLFNQMKRSGGSEPKGSKNDYRPMSGDNCNYFNHLKGKNVMETPRQKFNRFTKLATSFANELDKKNGDFFKTQMGLQALAEEVTRFNLFENKKSEMLFEFNELEILIEKMSSVAVSKTWVV